MSSFPLDIMTSCFDCIMPCLFCVTAGPAYLLGSMLGFFPLVPMEVCVVEEVI